MISDSLIQLMSEFYQELRTVILVRLRLADAPQFYDLPSMEVSLECLVNVSANHVNTSENNVLLQQLIITLLEVCNKYCLY